MKDLDLTTLRLFVAVCDARSIARVGEREHIVPSAISKRLAQLEQDLGCRLLTRIRRGIEPTAAGETLREHARGLLGAAQRVSDDMRAYTSGASGLVRLMATTSSVAESLPDDIADFLKIPAHQAIRVNVQEQLSRDVVRALHEGSVSLGICWDAADLSGLQTYPYRQDHLAIVTHEGHPLAGCQRLAFVDALAFDHVALPAASAVQLMLVRAAAASGQAIRYRAEVSTFEAALRVVRSGLGISVVPQEVAQPLAAAFNLCIIPLTDAWAQRRFAICFQDERSLSAAARLLAEYLAEVGRQA
jgi:DNA-binding transcriptional LysR family regulator